MMAARMRITSIPLMFLLLCSALLATTLQGVQGEVEVEGPSESECRPYIEKALKKLETGDTQSVEVQDDDMIHTVTTDDSETESGEAIESIQSQSTEEEGIRTQEEEGETKSIETAKHDGESEQTGDTQEVNAKDQVHNQEETEQADQPENASGEKETETEEAAKSEEESAVKEESEEQKSAEEKETTEEGDAVASTEQEKIQTSAEVIEEVVVSAEEKTSSQQESVGSAEQKDNIAASTEKQDKAVSSTEQDEAASSTEQEVQISTEETTNSVEETILRTEKEQEAASTEKENAVSAEQEGTPSTEHDDSTASTDEDAVNVEEDAASVEGGVSVEDGASIEDGAASVEEDAASVEEGEASVEEGAASVEEGTASIEEGAASVEEGASSVEKTSQEKAEEGAVSAEQDVTLRVEQESAVIEQVDAPSIQEAPAGHGKQDETVITYQQPETSEEKLNNKASIEKSEELTSVEQKDALSVERTDAVSSEQKKGMASVEIESHVEEKYSTEVKQADSAEINLDEKTSTQVVKEEEKSAEIEETKEESSKGEAESTPEEDLTWEVEIPSELRPRNHINEILQLNDEATELDNVILKAADKTLNELKKIYENAIKPLETLYKYRDLSNRHFGDPEIFSKPLVLFMGPWSGGKSSIINYLLDNEYTQNSLRTGAEPSPAYFNLLMWGEEPEILDGTQLAADWTFSGLQKFGQGLEERLRGLKLPNKLLEKINIVEIPGILEVRKQVSRIFPFNDACQWFIDRADIIFLVYDPSKLDVGPETEAILDQLKGREYQTRIILNKADQVKPEELMRVQGALIWNISPLMSSAQPPVMYSTSLWSRPYEVGSPVRLLQAQERTFLKDLKTAIDKRIENKIASARRFAVRVRNHAKMVDCYLTTYYNHKSVFGNKKLVSDQIIEHPQDYHIYEGLSTLTNISRYDLPDPDVYRDFFRLNPLYDFQQLSATCTYFRGCPINRLDVAIAYDLPELVGKYKKMVEPATNNNADLSTKS